MSRSLRGVWARRWLLLTLVALTAIVVAGTVSVIAVAQSVGGSPMLAAPLVVLGLVAVPAVGTALGTARRTEIGVARLRGLTGSRLLRLLLAETLIAVALGAVIGWLIGVFAVDASVGWAAHGAAVGVAIATAIGVRIGLAGVLREALADQVSVAERPRPRSTRAMFTTLLVVMAAGVAIYRAAVTGADDPDALVLVGPAVVGLAAGHLAGWLLSGVVSLLNAPSNGWGLPGYLAVRRLRNAVGVGGPVRLLVATVVIATVALTGASRIDQWATETARLEAGAPLRFEFERGAFPALELTRSLDPEGRWLMAGAYTAGSEDRRALLDLRRFEAVLGDFYLGTRAADVRPLVGELVRDQPGDSGLIVGQGDTLVLAASGPSGRLRIDITYLDDRGSVGSVGSVVEIGESALTIAVPDCAAGCAATGITVQRASGGAGGAVLVTRAELAGSDLLSQGWTTDPDAAPGGPAGLMIGRRGAHSFTLPAAALPVLSTTGPPSLGEVLTAGGVTREAEVIGRVEALPFVAASGVLADLPATLVGDSPSVPAATVVILARADTPPSVLDGLAAAGVGRPRAIEGVRRDVVEASRAGQARAYALMALCCLGVAALIAAALNARKGPRRNTEMASLRLLGLTRGQITRAGLVELGLVGAALAGVGGLGGVLAVRALLPTLPLVVPPEHGLPLAQGVLWWPPLVAGLAAALVWCLVGWRTARVLDGPTRPATLREEAGG